MHHKKPQRAVQFCCMGNSWACNNRGYYAFILLCLSALFYLALQDIEIGVAELIRTKIREKNNKSAEISEIDQHKSDKFIPDLYIITPTYSRPTQKADLIRVAHSLIISN